MLCQSLSHYDYNLSLGVLLKLSHIPSLIPRRLENTYKPSRRDITLLIFHWQVVDIVFTLVVPPDATDPKCPERHLIRVKYYGYNALWLIFSTRITSATPCQMKMKYCSRSYWQLVSPGRFAITKLNLFGVVKNRTVYIYNIKFDTWNF